MTSRILKRIATAALIACVAPLLADAQNAEASSATVKGAVPPLVHFSGAVNDLDGKPLSGTVNVTFRLYKEQEGGEPLWTETQTVEADKSGNYSVMLGSGSSDGLPSDIFAAGDARWLAVEAEGQTEQTRVLLLSVPYALKAGDAQTLGGKPASAFLTAAPQSEASVAEQGTNGSTPTNGSNPVNASSKSATTPLTSVSGGGTATFVPLWTGTPGKSSTTLGNSALFQSGTGSSAKIGLGTTTPVDALQVVAPNQLGILVEGPVSGVGAGLDMETTGSGGKGWEILATGNTSAQGVGKLNIRDLSTAADVLTIAPGGVVGIGTLSPRDPLQVTDKNHPGAGAAIAGDCSSSCAGVFGDATSTTDLTEGVFGQVVSSAGGTAGVKGEAFASTGLTFGVAGFNFSSGTFAAGVAAGNSASSGKTFGLSASSASPNGTGTFSTAAGESNTAKGILGCCAVGVWGDSASSESGAAGLVGTADDGRGLLAQNNSPSGVPAAFAFNTETSTANLPVFLAAGNVGGVFRSCEMDTNGNLACTGLKSAVVPVDEGQHNVALYAMEAPQNWFEDFGSGRLTSGAASVNLDRTFVQTVNTASDYHVFLTPEADCRGLYVDHKTVSGFEVHEIGGGQSNAAFAYRIVALRRGYENVRMEDMTERMNKIKTAPLPASPGPGVTLPDARSSAVGATGVARASN